MEQEKTPSEAEEKQKSLRDIADKFKARLANEDMSAERDFIDDLLNTVGGDNVKIPEPVFREIFMPFFTGQKESTGKEAAVLHWMGLVGGATNEADVVDVSGTTVFTVPPICDTATLNTERAEGYSPGFASIFSVYEDQSRVHWALGRQHLVENLAEKTSAIVKKTEISDGWKGMMDYYKLGEGAVKGAVDIKSNEMPGDDDLNLSDD